MEGTPHISVLMPVRNSAATVLEAVASIVLQTYQNWELVVLDDGSSDDTASLVLALEDDRIRVLHDGHHRGLPARLNEGVSLARGVFIARMDGDDVSHPERLERQLAYLESHPDCDVLATHMVVMDKGGCMTGQNRWRGGTHGEIVHRPWAGFHFNHATWMGRTPWFQKHPYRSAAVRSEDEDLLLRTYRISTFARLAEPLYAYRLGSLRLGSVLTARRTFCVSLVREAFRSTSPRLLLGPPLQAAKGLWEVIVLGSGIGLRALKHRNQPLDPETRGAWEQIIRETRAIAGQSAEAGGKYG